MLQMIFWLLAIAVMIIILFGIVYNLIDMLKREKELNKTKEKINSYIKTLTEGKED